MPDIRFNLTANAAQLLSEEQKVIATQKEVEQGYARIGKAATAAAGQASAAAAKQIDAYELAEAKTTGAISFGAGRRARAPKAYGFSAPVAAPATAAAIAKFTGTDQFLLRAEAQSKLNDAGWNLFQQQTQARMKRVQSLVASGKATRLAAAHEEGVKLADKFQAEYEAKALTKNNVLASVFRSNAASKAGIDAGKKVDWDAAQTRSAERMERVRASMDASHAKRMNRASFQGDLDLIAFEKNSPLNPDNIAKRKATMDKWGGRASSAARIATGAIGAAAYGGAQLASQIDEQIEKSSQARLLNVDQMRGLLGIGDNAARAGALTSGVLTKSTGLGMDAGTIANAQYNLESMASNLSVKTRSDLLNKAALVTKIKGGDLDTNQMALTKTFQNYGDQFKSVEQMTESISLIEERASVNFRELATFVPTLLPAAKEAGLSFSEMGAGLEVITQRAGKTEDAVTGYRNAILRMPRAEKVLGVSLRDTTFSQKLDITGAALDKLAPDDRMQAMLSIFGQKAMTYGSILLGNRKQFHSSEQMYGRGTETPLAQKMALKFSDPAYATAEVQKISREGLKNVGTMWSRSPQMRRAGEESDLIKLGIEATSDPMAPQALKDLKGYASYWTGYRRDPMKKAGLDYVVQSAEASGNQQAADYARLAHGDVSGIKYKRLKTLSEIRAEGALGKDSQYRKGAEASPFTDQATGQKEADEFLQLSKDYNISPDQFAQMLSNRSQGLSLGLTPGMRRPGKIAKDNAAAGRAVGIGASAIGGLLGSIPGVQKAMGAIKPGIDAVGSFVGGYADKQATEQRENADPMTKFATTVDDLDEVVDKFDKVLDRLGGTGLRPIPPPAN